MSSLIAWREDYRAKTGDTIAYGVAEGVGGTPQAANNATQVQGLEFTQGVPFWH